MGLTVVYIVICVSFILWLLLLLLIISKLGALNSRIARLATILEEFGKIDISGKSPPAKAETKQENP